MNELRDRAYKDYKIALADAQAEGRNYCTFETYFELWKDGLEPINTTIILINDEFCQTTLYEFTGREDVLYKAMEMADDGATHLEVYDYLDQHGELDEFESYHSIRTDEWGKA